MLLGLIEKLSSFSQYPERILVNVNKDIINVELLKELEEWYEKNSEANRYLVKTLLGDAQWIKVDYNSEEKVESPINPLEDWDV
jgi:hypothetical protein